MSQSGPLLEAQHAAQGMETVRPRPQASQREGLVSELVKKEKAMTKQEEKACWFCRGDGVSTRWFLFQDMSGVIRYCCENCAASLEAFAATVRNSDVFFITESK
jgi:hypothetical protein